MSANRQEEYDGKLNYEYIKLQSGAVSNNQARPSPSNLQKPRPRDHRLLATWSYFFSSKLYRIYLPWSEVAHISLLENTNPNAMPAKLEKTIVGFCFDENMKQQVRKILSLYSSRMKSFFQFHFSLKILLFLLMVNNTY